MSQLVKDSLAVLGVADIASVITAAAVILGATRRGRAWLIKPATESIKKLSQGQKRQELLFLINAYPRNVESIEKVYDEYKSLGGNSYVDSIVRSWRAEYERPPAGDGTGIKNT